MTEQPRTFADSVVAYAQAGWPCILPVPAHDKHPPPVGFTGAEGRDTDALQLVEWAGTHAAHAISLRMPDGVIGIDVDQYVKKGTQKRGAETLASCVERWGPLPATWSSTARGGDQGPGESRIMLFRVPPRRYVTKLTGTAADGTATADVEIIQRHHRYAVVWPSPHQDAGQPYRWYGPDGRPAEAPPKPEELAELPAAWVEGLAEGASAAAAASADHASGQALLDHLLEDHRTECAEITSARLVALDEMGKADPGSRHDTMTGRVHQLVQLAAGGHTGFGGVALALRALWEQLTAGEDRGEEFDRMLLTSARKAVTVVGTVQVPRDPCLMTAGFPVPGPAPEDDRPEDPENPHPPLEGVEPGRWYSVREAIGIHAFDPRAGLDQSLAEAVLERMYPALRYAYDSGSWLIRVPERWEERRDLGSWAVAQLAPLMPVGDPTAEKGTEQHTRAANRTRLMSTPGAKAVAGKIDALVKGGTHPASVRLGSLDSDPALLWAGGMAYALRDSLEGPAFAQVDPSTPHLHSAGVTPENRPTPLWDAFLHAVWPEEDVRRWALRVLSVALTGYADRALPILLGETGRGKTQVVHLLMSVLGSYAHAANPKLLNSGSHEHDTIVYALRGRRLSFIDEAPSDRKAGQERLKQLTGGGELTARQMNRDPITFQPTHTLVLTANDEPVLTDPAVRSRARLIPCEGDPEEVRQARAAIGHVSGAAWRQEAPGVLAAMMSEAAAWLADTSTALQSAAPEGIRYSAEIIAAEQDPITRWLDDETEPYEAGTPSRELYQAFVASCRQANINRDVTPSETKWGRELTRRGYPSVHRERGKVRPLRIRQHGGFWPTGDRPADGLEQNADGFLTGTESNPSGAFPQVNQSASVDPDGSDGLKSPLTRDARAHTRGEANPENAETGQDPSGDVSEQDGLFEAPEPPPRPAKAKREQTETARQKRAEMAAERRAAAVAEAAGEHHDLPATVTAHGAIASCSTEEAAALLRGTRELTIDVEHTGYPVGHRHYALRTVQLGHHAFAIVLDPGDPGQADLIRSTIAAAEILHAHSAAADLVPLEVAGLLEHGYEEAWSRMHDTVNLAKLADPTSTGSDPSLKKLARAVLRDRAISPDAEDAKDALFKAGKWLKQTKVTTPLEKSGWAQVDHRCATMIRYDASDVIDAAALAKLLPQPEPAVLERERLAEQMTARVALHGLALDGDQVVRLRGEQQTALADASERLSAFGVENPGSDQQVAAAVEGLGLALPRTKTGRPSVASGVLEPHAGAAGPLGDLARARLDYQTAENRLGLFLEGYHLAVEHGDGRVRPTVYTLEAKSGRMSCVRPNLQQVPREGGYRACIVADPGMAIISADLSSVELRVAAALSGDRELAAIQADPERDLHREVAQIVWGPQATKEHRYQAKRKVFGRIYGSGINGLMTAVPPVSEPIARAIVDALTAVTPTLTDWSRQVADGIEAGRTQFRTYSGRIVHMPVDRPYAGPNYCIQGTARELLVDALERWSRTRWGDCVLLPVHDELVAVVPEDEAEEATQTLVECMTAELLGVPIIAEADEPSRYWRDSA